MFSESRLEDRVKKAIWITETRTFKVKGEENINHIENKSSRFTKMF